jgi:DNA-directed RNA polymerase subunit beta'
VKQGYDYVSAKKAVTERNPAAINVFNRVIKQIPIILNRAPTLMASNITAFYPKPIDGKTIGLSPLALPGFAADYDGDSFSTFVPMTPGAIEEAKKKLLPEHHIHDYRKGLNNSMVAPGHEAIIGSMYMTEPDTAQKTRVFKTESEVISAFKSGDIKENTPIEIKG